MNTIRFPSGDNCASKSGKLDEKMVSGGPIGPPTSLPEVTSRRPPWVRQLVADAGHRRETGRPRGQLQAFGLPGGDRHPPQVHTPQEGPVNNRFVVRRPRDPVDVGDLTGEPLWLALRHEIGPSSRHVDVAGVRGRTQGVRERLPVRGNGREKMARRRSPHSTGASLFAPVVDLEPRISRWSAVRFELGDRQLFSIRKPREGRAVGAAHRLHVRQLVLRSGQGWREIDGRSGRPVNG